MAQLLPLKVKKGRPSYFGGLPFSSLSTSNLKHKKTAHLSVRGMKS
jgi:hypothetical protein